ncbi:MAG: transporter [Mucilaginibacter sp.]|uniref:SphA family protein n=1 Tax=Mucilaginibacter sp. TaxID=1882438 RepID=UPI0031AB21FE
MKAMLKYTIRLLILFLLLNFSKGYAQDPKLPATNLGMINMQDGNPAPGSGWIFREFVQSYQSGSTRDGLGKPMPAPTISSLLSISQLIYQSDVKIADGYLGYTFLVPLVKISAANSSGEIPAVNPGYVGDMTAGVSVQWYNKKLFGLRFSHRLEADLGLPTGDYNTRYAINPSSHLYNTTLHYTFTMFLTDKFAISMRHHLTYNFNEIGTSIKPGMFYNFNYSLEYPISERVRAEIAGYYLTQINQDTYSGNSNYYQHTFGIADTRERIFAIGPGMSYQSPSGLFMELKGLQETAAKNRTQGFRLALGLAYLLDKH